MKIDDLTIIYYTANNNNPYFMKNTQEYLLKAVGDTPIISVSFEPTVIGNNCENICIGKQQRSNYMLYKQVLIGVRAAKTKYVAMAEDDTLYPTEHFLMKPPEDELLYDVNKWSIFSWEKKKPIFSKREGRRTMNMLIAPRELLLKNLEDRYAKYPTFESIPPHIWEFYWGEPGRFDDHLGIPRPKSQKIECEIPSIMWSTPEALGFLHLGTRKAHAKIQATEDPYWGKAEDLLKLYQYE
jgi:hypothetical protein